MLLRGARRRRFAGTIVVDTFTRADSAVSLGTSSSGHVWTQSGGVTWGIQSNKAYPAAQTTYGLATVAAGNADGTIECDVTWGTGEIAGVIVRSDGTANNRIVYDWSSTTLAITKVVAGVATVLTSVALVPTNGVTYRFKLTFAGSNYTALLDGTQQLTTSDAALATNTKHGLSLLPSAAILSRFDNFTVSA